MNKRWAMLGGAALVVILVAAAVVWRAGASGEQARPDDGIVMVPVGAKGATASLGGVEVIVPFDDNNRVAGMEAASTAVIDLSEMCG